MLVNCAISGIPFTIPAHFSRAGVNISLPHTAGYYHPIFACSSETLYKLYYKHTQNELTKEESYLLFLAFLHSSGKIDWVCPAAVTPTSHSTIKLVQNNIAQLIRVLEKTATIKHPAFKQPAFKVNIHTSDLETVPNWILAWEENIRLFSNKLATIENHRTFQQIENRLTQLIVSGTEPKKFSAILSDWACEAGDFPAHKAEEYKKVIRSCYNGKAMFNTQLALIKEVKEYCEVNIQAGSIHFHTLCETLKEGIHKHIDYLGGSSYALGYTLLPKVDATLGREQEIKEARNNAEVEAIIANAPEAEPRKEDYPTNFAYIKARLAYRLKQNQDNSTIKDAGL